MTIIPKHKLTKMLGIDIDDCTILYEFKKKRSQYFLRYLQDPHDNGIIYVVSIKNVSTEIVNCSVILAKDLQKWIDHDKEVGWELLIN